MPTRAERIYLRAAEENRRAILRAMDPRPGCVLLDVGCADGTDTVAVMRAVEAAHTIGLELADKFIAPARARGIDVRKVDISEPWPLEDESVDVVHSNQVIEHLAQTDHFMREVHRVMRSDGYAVISTNNLASWHNIFALVLGWQPLPAHVSDEVVIGNPLALDEQPYGERIHRHLRLFTPRALSALAEAHGLQVDSAIGSGYYPFGPRASRMLARLDRRHAAYVVQRYRRE
jgi:SAM-dependent methyltransferase